MYAYVIFLKDFEIIPPELDLVEEDDKNTHLINLDDAIDSEEMLSRLKLILYNLHYHLYFWDVNKII